MIQLTAKIPFDDRVNTHASIEELNFVLLREHLSKIKSKLYQESASMLLEKLADNMNLSQGAKEHLFHKNIVLLMFLEKPKKFFKGVHVDVVEFSNGLGAKEFNEKTFEGPIQKKLTDVLLYLKTNIIKSKVIKHEDRPESDKNFNYPYEAIEVRALLTVCLTLSRHSASLLNISSIGISIFFLAQLFEQSSMSTCHS